MRVLLRNLNHSLIRHRRRRLLQPLHVLVQALSTLVVHRHVHQVPVLEHVRVQTPSACALEDECVLGSLAPEQLLVLSVRGVVSGVGVLDHVLGAVVGNELEAQVVASGTATTLVVDAAVEVLGVVGQSVEATGLDGDDVASLSLFATEVAAGSPMSSIEGGRGVVGCGTGVGGLVALVAAGAAGVGVGHVLRWTWMHGHGDENEDEEMKM